MTIHRFLPLFLGVPMAVHANVPSGIAPSPFTCSAYAMADLGHSPAGSTIDLKGFPVEGRFPDKEINNGDLRIHVFPGLSAGPGVRNVTELLIDISHKDGTLMAIARSQTASDGAGTVTAELWRKNGFRISGIYGGRPVRARAVSVTVSCRWRNEAP